MSYAEVVADTIAQERGLPPTTGRRQDTGALVDNLRAATVAVQEACGWYAVQSATRPPDDDTQTSDRSLTWTGSQVDETWTSRAWTAEESAAQAAETDRLERVNQDRRNNDSYLLNPTDSQVASLTAQMTDNTAATAPDTVRPVWAPGADYAHNVQVDYGGTGYRVIQSHTSQLGWEPPNVPALFERTKDSDQWEVGVPYVIDEEVLYLTARYKCLQAHTSQAGWEPPNVPAIWELIP